MTRKWDAFYAENAAKGRTVRFTIDCDLSHVSEEDRERAGLQIDGFRIGRGTLTAAQMRRILDIISEGP